MATTATITPTLGSAPVTLQAGNYSAIDDRRFWGANLDEYALTSTSYQVIQRAAGANMTVDVTSSLGDGALVRGDSVTAQGLYMVPPTAANVNVDIAAADATNPRNDLVVLEVKDDQHDAGGLNLARVRVITGTPNASAAATDAPGANGTPALPSSCFLLAVVRVPAGVTSVTTAYINDRRTYSPSTSWIAYTPTLTASITNPTLGTGSTQTGHYCQNGKLVFVRFVITFGAGGGAAAGSGTYRINYPITAAANQGTRVAGTGYLFDNSANAAWFTLIYGNNTTTAQFLYQAGAGTYGIASAAAPMTWAAGDSIDGYFTYEAA